MRLPTPLLFLFSTMIGLECATSKEADVRSSYGSTVSDPGLFHYAKMQDALSYGNVKLASDHAHARTQFLTLTFRPNYTPKRSGAIQLRFEPSPEPIQIDEEFLEAKKVNLLPKSDFSEEMRKMLRENEDTFQSLAPPPE